LEIAVENASRFDIKEATLCETIGELWVRSAIISLRIKGKAQWVEDDKIQTHS
jgi:hypothetical protein